MQKLWVVIAVLACSAAGAQEGSAEKPRPVAAPHYGDGLFHHFQNHHFDALGSLMVSQHFERVLPHAVDAELLRGSLLLGYGLHQQAGDIFASLIDSGAPPAVRDRAWFYLAKMRHQRGLLDEAQDALGRIARPLEGELQTDRLLLQAQVLMALGDAPAAAALLAGPAAQAKASPYLRFNLGVALIRSGNFDAGAALLQALGRAGAAEEEQRSLRDRANLALGYAALQQQRPQDARLHLERVRLHGAQANKALLGFGWAAASLKEPRRALVPWLELSQRDSSDAAVLEARLAVPYAHAELGALPQALAGYEQALAAFEAEAQALEASQAAVRAGGWIDDLLQRNPANDMHSDWAAEQLPTLPHARQLAPMLAGHEFQEALKNHRDLLFLHTRLLEWQDKLGVYADMLANRRQAYAERSPTVQAQARQSGLAALQQRRQTLAAQVEQAASTESGEAFASAEERVLLQRLARVRAALQAAGNDADAAELQERARRVAGALAWQLAQTQPMRQWEAQKALKGADAGLAQAIAQTDSLARAQVDEPQRFDAFAARQAALARRLQALLPPLAGLQAQSRAHLQGLAVAELQQQQQRLAAYATQARFAIAQIQDRALALSPNEAPR